MIYDGLDLIRLLNSIKKTLIGKEGNKVGFWVCLGFGCEVANFAQQKKAETQNWIKTETQNFASLQVADFMVKCGRFGNGVSKIFRLIDEKNKLLWHILLNLYSINHTRENK